MEITGNVCRCQTVLPQQSYYSKQKILPDEHFEKLIVLIVCGRQVRSTRRLLRNISKLMGLLLQRKLRILWLNEENVFHRVASNLMLILFALAFFYKSFI